MGVSESKLRASFFFVRRGSAVPRRAASLRAPVPPLPPFPPSSCPCSLSSVPPPLSESVPADKGNRLSGIMSGCYFGCAWRLRPLGSSARTPHSGLILRLLSRHAASRQDEIALQRVPDLRFFHAPSLRCHLKECSVHGHLSGGIRRIATHSF